MTRGALLLTLTLLMTIASGCIAYQEDDSRTDDTESRQGSNPPAQPPSVYDGPMAVEPVYSDSWSGPKQIDDDITYDTDYDYLLYSYSNSGQQSTPIAFTSSAGDEMDSGLIGNRNGVFTLTRVLPGGNGTAHIESAAPVSGSGSLTIMGIQNVRPTFLFSASWSGQASGLPLLGTAIGFFVPEDLDTAYITLAGSGQNAPELRIQDPDGNTVASMDAMTGSDVISAEATATPGLWSFVIDGAANGSFTVNVASAPA